MITLKRVLILGVLGAFLALGATACSDDSTESNSSAQQSDIEAANARVQRNEVMFALKIIGDLPLHDMDESINAGEIGDDYLPNAREVVYITAVTNWPAELEEGATAVQDAAIALVDALDAGDAEAAKQPSTDLHDAWHDFEHEAVAWTAEGSDVPTQAGLEDDHSGGATTPAADATPGAETTPAAEGTAAEGENHSEDETPGAEGDDHSE